MKTLFLKQGLNLKEFLAKQGIENYSISQSHLTITDEDLKLGYYMINNEYMLIVHPDKAYIRNSRTFGFHIQLSSLVGSNYYGIGDFGSLLELLHYTKKVGGSFIQINPVYAIDHSWFNSPYEPISRFSVDPIYIDLNLLFKEYPDYDTSYIDTLDTSFIKEDKINYTECLIFKHKVLYNLFEFLGKPAYNTFDDLANKMASLHSEFLEFIPNDDVISFLNWIYLIADLQFASIKKTAKENNVGIIVDLPMGLSPETIDNSIAIKKELKPTIEISEQCWSISSIDYNEMANEHYSYFIDSISCAMKDAYAIRIDNDTSLRKIKVLNNNNEVQELTFNNYDDLLKIIMLESQLNECEVILECPFNCSQEEVADLENKGFNFQNLYLFTVDPTDNLICEPHEFPKQSSLVFSTHDIYPLKAHLTSTNNYMDLSDTEDENWKNLIQIQNWYLDRELATNFNLKSLNIDKKVRFSHLLGAKSSANMFSIALSDLMLMTEQFNIPNTSFGFQNWCLKLTENLIDFFSNSANLGLLSDIKKLRKLNP